ncbi:MAG: TA system VapC family ribonuclease toxin [Vicinamibacterales bacterium]
MPRVALLDVNVLVALFDPEHVHHEIAHDWFADRRAEGWSTCPVTENAFVRVLSNPAYGRESLRPTAVLAALQEFRASGHHVFWPDGVSLTDQRLFDAKLVAGHRQLTDLYLLGLATRMKGALATFDRTIPLKAVVGATSATLELIAPADMR